MTKYIDEVLTYLPFAGTVADLTADTTFSLTRTTGKYLVAEGDYVQTVDGGFYQVVASGGDVVSAGGIHLSKAPMGVGSPFDSRASFASVNIPASVTSSSFLGPDGVTVLSVTEDASATYPCVTTNGGARKWVPALFAHAWHFGAIGDGVTDNTAVISQIKGYCTETGKDVNFGSGGVFLTNQIIVSAGEYFLVFGNASNRPTIKLNDGQNLNLLFLTGGTSVLWSYGIIWDQNEVNQTAGHGIRSGGCASIVLLDTRVQNAYNYGIGLQGGTTAKFYARNLELFEIGNDGIDVKDYDLANGVIEIDGVHGRNWGNKNTDKPLIDIRGPCNIRGVTGEANNDCIGVRYRLSGAQGRGGHGIIDGVRIIGNGVDPTTVVRMETDRKDAIVANVSGEDVSYMLVQSTTGTGGIVRGLVGKGVFGDGVSIGGSNLKVSDAYVESSVAASRCLDVEATASRVRLENFNATILNPATNVAARIFAGATDTLISGDMTMASGIVGGTNGVSDAGTNSDISGVRGFA